MILTVLFFAQLRSLAGGGERRIELADDPADVLTVADLKKRLECEDSLGALGHLPLRYAVNEEFVEDGHALKDGDVVALIPPVSGG